VPPHYLAGCLDGQLLLYNAEEFTLEECVNLLGSHHYHTDVINVRVIGDQLITAGDRHLCGTDTIIYIYILFNKF
jgi:hypothetical protein